MLKLLSTILAWATLMQLATTIEYAPPAKDAQVAPAFRKANIVPDVVDTPPNVYATVIYPPNEVVDLGTKETNFIIEKQPVVTWRPIPGKLYTLLCFGPDFPANDLSPGYVFWQVVNIPGNDVTQGTDVAVYLNVPNVPATGDSKRQVFFVLEQQNRLDTSISVVTSEARLLNVKDYIANNHLSVYAGNFAKLGEL